MFHSTGGYQSVGDPAFHSPIARAFIDAGVELGYEQRDINAERLTGYVLPQGTIRHGSRCSTAKAFLRPVRNRPNLHISMRSYVHKILVNSENRAFAVKYEKEGQIQVVRARKEVVLSAGALMSPHILMHSGIGDCRHLEEHNVSQYTIVVIVP
jgi:glucose dehydrogenase (acceptor)